MRRVCKRDKNMCAFFIIQKEKNYELNIIQIRNFMAYIVRYFRSKNE